MPSVKSTRTSPLVERHPPAPRTAVRHQADRPARRRRGAGRRGRSPARRKTKRRIVARVHVLERRASTHRTARRRTWRSDWPRSFRRPAGSGSPSSSAQVGHPAPASGRAGSARSVAISKAADMPLPDTSPIAMPSSRVREPDEIVVVAADAAGRPADAGVVQAGDRRTACGNSRCWTSRARSSSRFRSTRSRDFSGDLRR